MKVLKDTVENWFPLSFSLLGLNWAMSRANRRVPLFQPPWAGLVAPTDTPHRGRPLLSQGPCPSLESSSSPAPTPRWAPINVIRFRSWSIWISQILLPNSRIKACSYFNNSKNPAVFSCFWRWTSNSTPFVFIAVSGCLFPCSDAVLLERLGLFHLEMGFWGDPLKCHHEINGFL